MARRRRPAGAHVESPALESTWERIRDEAQAPPPGVVQRLLTRLGVLNDTVAEPDALLIAVAPSLRVSWLLGLAVTLGFVGLSAAQGGSRGLAFFLLVAPLVPVAGVAFAYGPAVDDAYEVGVAAPYPAGRLLMLRAAAALATSLPLVLAAALLLPGLTWAVVSWLLPALAFTAPCGRSRNRNGQPDASEPNIGARTPSACGDRLHLAGRRRTGGSVLRRRSSTYATRAWWMVPAR